MAVASFRSLLLAGRRGVAVVGLVEPAGGGAAVPLPSRSAHNSSMIERASLRPPVRVVLTTTSGATRRQGVDAAATSQCRLLGRRP